ncbi:MAG: VOC family protein [Dehalococcoidia bacterium]|nr:VOC family protein [Dehalococcoidia bacterium]
MSEYVFDHLHFKSSDVDVTAKFLSDNFGGQEMYRRSLRGAPTIGMNVGGQDILIIGNFPEEPVLSDSTERRYGLDHFGFLVKDINVAYEELTGKGLKFSGPPIDLGSLKFAFVLGPDNIRIEIVQRA